MKFRFSAAKAAAVLAGLLLSACGDYSGGSAAGGSGSGGGGGGAAARSMEEHFGGKVQPQLDFCRTCHIPGGVADVENGKDFMLSATRSQDLANLRASWERLGGNNPTSRILLMSSGQETPHTGGTPWPTGSAQYKNMEILLKCFESPSGCAALLAGGIDAGTLLPLLGSKRGGSTQYDYCVGKPDAAPLPVDPRSLVQPGVNAGKAVVFNDWWKDCHVDPERVGEMPHAETCGELRARAERGKTLVLGNGAVGAGSLLAGTEHNGYAAIPASVYNNVWRSWGLNARPANFDELLLQRWGFAFGNAPNPYPLPGEDPNARNGGSGRLPTAFTQLRKADGSWSGNIGLTCHGCHSSVVGSAGEGSGLGVTMYGAGSSPHDMGLMAQDLGAAGQPIFAALSFTGALGKTRGTGNPINLQLIIVSTVDIRLNPNTLPFFTAPSAGSEDAPAWWNMGHRPVKFYDGFLSMDADRSDLGLYLPFLDKKPIPSLPPAARAWVRERAQDVAAWATSLKSPEYPLPVDAALAEQGAILFHAKDLWGTSMDNPVPRPPSGNGSCASCHGAYSPRYANDPAYLETPALEGMAGYLVPHEIIGTDPRRANANNEGFSEYGRGNFYAYPETDGMAPENDCTPTTRVGLRGDRQPGYLAPPLYGLWATAPYFHNGSVPNAWEVLKPADRQSIWRRVSAPAPVGQEGVVMGFDTSLARAYDPQKLGWQYEPLACGAGTLPFIECNPVNDGGASAMDVLSALYHVVGLSWNVELPAFTSQQAEDRKVYNSHAYSQGNGGHEFTAGLSDQERRALIEYLKTL
ncbi:MAG TPA: hypothetical protein VLI06_06385 [Solimonas sp.]|nr:hypothetical protein [Solimonas sp.]